MFWETIVIPVVAWIGFGVALLLSVIEGSEINVFSHVISSAEGFSAPVAGATLYLVAIFQFSFARLLGRLVWIPAMLSSVFLILLGQFSNVDAGLLHNIFSGLGIFFSLVYAIWLLAENPGRDDATFGARLSFLIMSFTSAVGMMATFFIWNATDSTIWGNWFLSFQIAFGLLYTLSFGLYFTERPSKIKV